jgi:hypothetical protein
MRSYPQPEFSLAKRTMSASSSGAMRGRPGEERNLEPSNLLGNEPPVPGEDGIGLGDTGDLLKCSPAEPFADFSKGGSLGIRKAYTGGKVGSEDAILSCEVFILEQEFLIDQPGDVRQQPSPFVVWHEEHPS